MIERKHFTGGMDAENTPDFIAPNDYLVAENCRMFRNEDGNGASFKPVNGTTLRLGHENVAPKYCIGSITDEAKGRVYFFMYHGGTGQDHTIWAWDRKTNTGYRVLRTSQVEGGLGFDRRFPVTGLALIGDDLYWTNNKSNPRRVNVERGIKTNNPTYVSQDGTTPDPYALQIKQTDISVARKVPTYPLLTTKIVSEDDPLVEDRPSNFIELYSFQFAYRYGYRSGEYSTVGPYSMVVPQNAEGEEYDTIKVALSKSEIIDNEVKSIEFLVRRGNTGSFSIIKTFDRDESAAAFATHNTPTGDALSYYFFNETMGVEVADSEAYVPFFDVPILSKSLEVAQNRLFLGNNVKGYDYPSGMDIILSLSTTESLIKGSYYLLEVNTASGPQELIVVRISSAYGAVAGWYPTVYTKSQFNTNSLPAIVTLDIADRYPVPNLDVPPDDLVQFIYPGYINYSYSLYTVLSPTINGLGSFTNNAVTFRAGSKYKVHIVFYDFAGRNAGVMHEPEEIIIPAATYEQSTWVTGINFVLQNDPSFIPLWATSYGIVRTKVDDFFVDYYADGLKYGALQDDESYDFSSNTYSDDFYDAIGVPLSELTEDGIGYTFTEGDIVRLIDSGGTESKLRVLGTQGDWLIAELEDLGDFSGVTYFVEIYRPVPAEDVFYEVGRNYKVNNPGLSSRTLSVSSGTIRGDAFLITRELGGVERAVQAMNRNNKVWFDWPQDAGRPSKVVYSKQKRYPTEIAWGGLYFPGTETNDLSAFLSGDIKILEDSVGAINKLSFTSRTGEYGTVLLAVGATEAASIYLGRTEMYNAVEQGNILSSANVIGTINVLRGGFGTINPESFVENDGNAYWFCANKAAFVRYNRNGVVPISDYKFAPVAKWLANKVLLAEAGVDEFLIVGGFDEYNQEYLVTTPIDSIRRFPITYEVLGDLDEEVAATTMGGGVYKATLEAGELYKLVVGTASGQTVTIGLTDLYFGAISYSADAGTSKEVQFFAPADGLASFTIIPIGAPLKSIVLYKQRLNPYLAVNKVPKTFAFSEVNNRWSAVYRFTPDWYGKIADVLVSFKNAILYTHDDTTNKSKFYGVTYKSWFSFVASMMPNLVKRFQGISLETDTTPDYIHIRTELPDVQSSDIVQSEFSDLEGVPYASFRKDGLSPNVSGTRFVKQAKGDDMVGRYAKILVEYAKNVKFVTRMVNIISRPSTGHKL